MLRQWEVEGKIGLALHFFKGDGAVLRHLLDSKPDRLKVLLARGDELASFLKGTDHVIEVHLAGLHPGDKLLEPLEIVFKLHAQYYIKQGRSDAMGCGPNSKGRQSFKTQKMTKCRDFPCGYCIVL